MSSAFTKGVVTFLPMVTIAVDKLGKGKETVRVRKISGDTVVEKTDAIIKEAPLEIILGYSEKGSRKKEVISVTMRTPGDDFNMVTGFLFAEHIIHQSSDIVSIRFSGNSDEPSLQENSVLVELSPDVRVELSEQKNFITHSACGFCGRNSFDGDSKEGVFAPLSDHIKILTSTLFQLPVQLQAEQSLFAETGGSHAVALFDLEGELQKMAEDAGRHNAMDKLLGVMLREKKIPLSNYMALFSGRLSYELVQKALAGGIPVVASIGAPTSLAVELASDYNITVIGFLKEDRMNIYCGQERIVQG